MKLLITLFIVFDLIVWTLYFARSNQAAHQPKMAIATPTIAPTPVPLNADKLFQLVNSWRTENGYQPYSWNTTLCGLSDQRVIDIQTNWSHDGFVSKERALGIYGYFGENLSRGYITEQETLNAWINSPEHYRNLINPNFSRACISCDMSYCAQEFSSSF